MGWRLNNLANTLKEMQQEQPQFYATLTSHLTANEQAVIHTVCQQAEAQSAIAGAPAPANGTS